MALVLKDRVKETTATTGTGTVTLVGAVSGFQSFAAIGDGNQTYYVISDAATGDWEVGIGTYTASGTTLSRTTVLSSSNAGSLVPFAAGTKDVFVSYPSSRSVYLDTAGSAVTVLDIGTLGTSTANITTANITAGTVSTTPTNNTDIVNKQYADAIASGIHFHEAVNYATATALPACTYSNGTGGVGATLTGNVNGALTVDGYTFTSPADDGMRILIKDQASGLQNGVYTLTQAGNSSPGAPFILTRATDFDSVGTGVDQIDEGDFFLVTGGTVNANTAWVQQTPPPITLGTTAIVFQQFAAPITYTAGAGLSESPSYTFNIATTGVTAATYGSASSVPVITVNAQGQATLVVDTPIAISGSAVSGSISGQAGSVANALTAGTYLTSGGTYDGSVARTFAVDATSANTASKVVARDASGNFSAGTITATLSGAATSATTATNIAGGAANQIPYQTGAGATSFTVAPSASNQVLNWNGSAFTWSAGTISGVPLGSNLNTLTLGTSGTGLSGSTTYNGSGAATFTVTSNATSANTASTIVARDGSGNFSAGTITASLSGAATQVSNAVTFNNGGAGGASGSTFNGSGALTVSYNTVGAPSTTGANASGTWGINITGSAGSAGSVAWGNISGRPSNIMYYQGFTLDANTMDSNATGFTYAVNAPYTGPVVRFSTGGSYDLWLNSPYTGGNNIAFRTRNGDAGSLNSWRYPVVYDINGATGALYGTIFYDSNNTGYYVDPASASNLNQVRGYYWWTTFTPTNAPRWDCSFYVLQSQHWYSQTGAQTMYLGESGDFVYIRGYSTSDQSFRAPIFYDSNNTGYYVDPASTSALVNLNLYGTLNVTGSNAFFLSASNGAYQRVDSRNESSDSRAHWYGVTTTGGTSNFRHAWYDGSAYFNVTASGGEVSFARVGGGGYVSTSESFRAPIFYDSNNTNYYVDPASTSEVNKVYYNSNMVSRNYGIGQVGLYDSYRYQAVFSMGESYILPANGTTTGNLYGIAWSHPNAGGAASNLASHGMLILENGGFQGAWGGGRLVTTSDIRGTIFYDYNNTGYYCDPSSVSYLYGLTLAGGSYFRPNNWIQLDGDYGIYSAVYNSAHFLANISSSYGQWRIIGSRNGWAGIYDTYSAVNGFMYDGSGNGGVYREANGRWYLYYHLGNDCLSVGTASTSSTYSLYLNKGVYAQSRIDATIYYDSNDTGYYVNPNGSSQLAAINCNSTCNFTAGTSTYSAFMYGNGNTASVSGIGMNIYSTGGAGALMAFHRGGYYAVNMGLDSDNVLRIGGWSAPANLFQMDMSGNLTMAGNVTAYSDERLKKDWAELPDDFVERLAQIKSGTYTRIDSGERQMGVSAQDFRDIGAEAVSEDASGTLSLAYGNAALAACVELAKSVVALRAELNALRAH